MNKIVSEFLKNAPIFLALLAIFFTIYESVETRKIEIKKEHLNSLLRWQNANQKIMCYINQSKNKSQFSKELVESYSQYSSETDKTLLKLKQELVLLGGFGFNSLNRVFNEQLVFLYELHGAYYKDFSEIKEKLSDEEFRNAQRFCEHKI
jgi:coproporphyrinogen III oxidase